MFCRLWSSPWVVVCACGAHQPSGSLRPGHQATHISRRCYPHRHPPAIRSAVHHLMSLQPRKGEKSSDTQQISMFDLDSCCGKTFPEPSPAAPQKARTSASSWKRSSALKFVMFQSLDLTPGAGNLLGESYWELISPWRGDALTLNTGVSPREERESSLSQILQVDPPSKYYLTRKACLGILRRAFERGKGLPKKLQEALEIQSGIASLGSIAFRPENHPTSQPNDSSPPIPPNPAGVIRTGRDWIQKRESYRELNLENIEYNYLCRNDRLDRDMLNELVELMVDTVCSRRETIRVAGDVYLAEMVKSNDKRKCDLWIPLLALSAFCRRWYCPGRWPVSEALSPSKSEQSAQLVSRFRHSPFDPFYHPAIDSIRPEGFHVCLKI